MALSADSLLDRIHLKGQLTRWRMLAILCAALLLVVVAERFSPMTPMKRDYIARLNIDGVILDDPERDTLLKELAENTKVKAVIVRLDTPGGSAVGGEELYLQLKTIAKNKPVVAVMRTMSTSAGYMVALAADQIFAREGTITGSIGVIIQMAEFSELAKKLGITPITIKSGPYKGSPSFFEKMTPEQGEVVQRVITDFYETFVNMIVERRKLPREEVLRLADGRIYSGRQAVELKLIDAIGGEADALAWLTKIRKVKAELEIRDAKPKKKDETFIQKLSESTRAALLPETLRNRLDGLVLIWQPNTL